MDSMSEAFDQMQMVKDVLANSDKVSEVLQESTHQFNLLTSPTFLPKVKDQGKFTLPCTLGHLELDNALVDSGASINLISLSMAEKLGIAGALQRPTTSIMFGDATSKSPLGVFKNYHLKIGECIIQTDLTVGLAQPMPKKLSLGVKGASSTDSSIELETRATRSSSTTRPRGGNGSPMKKEVMRLRVKRKEKRSIKRLRSEHESNENVPMEEAESEEEDELPMYQEHYNALFSMDFVETKYPHDDT
ncbi:unnamed protein product [Microthlaspi erraticum]|uniref:Aspartic peptidase DDI1-type domain-containing protein n=1 Tax=Microthlaspi erraticum TaxID=1685480 RepID=A0A6D2KQ18_9BRAS|nr:unnamed protein product [Microthlaspi erraticum]